ncbi:transposase, partial [Bacillus cereus]|uniref:transposase n=1 Tax=Bacillus cereus TaxID=1396 RepID=UPI003D6A7D45
MYSGCSKIVHCYHSYCIIKELVQEICGELDISIVAMECDKDHVHLFLNTPPTLSPADTMAKI